jgi:hypothetical protein
MRRAAGLAAAFVLAFGGGFATPGQAAAFDLGGWQYDAATGHYYAQVDGTTWVEAEDLAVSYGGHLVTVNDQMEQDWLSATFPTPNLFIGLNDREQEGTWVWTSGEVTSFFPWTPGEPNDWEEGVPGEDFAVMNWTDEGGTVGWNDVPETEPAFSSAVIELTAPLAEPAYFWIDNASILVTSATVQRDGMLTITGTANCVLMTTMPWGDDYPAAHWDWTGDNEGYYWYDMQGWARQSLGRKTLLSGGGWGRVDCTNNVWTYQSLADNGRFGPNASTIWFQMGEWRENGFYGIADHYEYLKVTKAR